MKDRIEKLERHLTLNPCDTKVELALFDLYDRLMLDEAIKAHPHSIIYLPNYDLITPGLKGAVPYDWDGSIIHL